MKNIEINDWVEFKSDIEQGGEVIGKKSGGWLVLQNRGGFIGGYIGGDTRTEIHEDDVYAVRKPVKKTPVAKRPKPGTTSALVWDTADALSTFSREEIIKILVERGVNKATASTQYSRWKKANK